MRNYLVWILALLLTGFVFGCGDDDADTDGGATDTDTDTDSDSDSDSDSDTDVCNPPEGVTPWGGFCNDTVACPANTECLYGDGMSTDEGFCAPRCCTYQSADPTYCTDQGSGEEQCSVSNEGNPPYYCLIVCQSEADCPTGTACTDTGQDFSICYGAAEVADAGADAS